MNGSLVIIPLDDVDNQPNSDRGDEQGVQPLRRVDGQDGYVQAAYHYCDVRRTIEDKLKVTPLIARGTRGGV